MRNFPQFYMECGDLTGSPKTNLTAYVSLFENALRALRAFPKGKKHQKLRTLGYPPFMEKLIQGQPGRGGPSHLRKSMKITNLTGFFSRKKHVKQVIFIDFLRWLGHPLAGFSCMSSCIKGAIKLVITCAHLFFMKIMIFLCDFLL